MMQSVTHLFRLSPLVFGKILVLDASLRSTLEAECTVVRFGGCETAKSLCEPLEVS